MQFLHNYTSPLGIIYLTSDGKSLTGLWFEHQKYFPEFIYEFGNRIHSKTEGEAKKIETNQESDLKKKHNPFKIKVIKKSTLPLFDEVKHWLDLYFSGKNPDFFPPIKAEGSAFRQLIWGELLKIPFGEVTTYGDIGSKLAEQGKAKKGSAQAIGGAVGHNPISIIIPCHRVVGADDSLTGYAGGLDKKKYLLKLEGYPVS
ncbi:MAG: methylated-DNA--[protein]-cysteine S-methyltransferase [Lachnospiraceae bacterium]|nr:methylated-DNA--[protein]-cysteine S-methyltransferase [Lachnospiraceae bacterium]